MKKITSVILFLTTILAFGQNAPIDFETGGQGADWTWTVFENDDNPPLTIVPNPDATGANTSGTVAQFTARDLGAPFAGVESMHGSDIGTFDLSAANAFVSIKVYKTKISDVGIKFATPPGGAQPEIKVANTVVNQWETLTFDFTGYIGLPETTGLDQIIIFPDFFDRTADDVIYFDDITFSDSPPPAPVALPVDFEQPVANYNFVGFEGADSAIESNAVPGGINTSATVMRTIKTSGSQFFAGTFLDLDVPIDFSGTQVLTMKTYSPKADIPVRMALENQATGNQVFVDVNTTVMDEWETLSFDFSGLTDPAIDYNRVVVFFEFVVDLPGDGSTYYYDDIELGEPLSVSEFEATDIILYPNPVTALLNVQSTSEISNVRITSITGQITMEQIVNATAFQMNIESLKTGVYFATIKMRDGRQETIKVIKN